MSLDINLFVNGIDDSIIPKWIDELNTLGMVCEVHPEFSFNDHKGFLPFKVNVKDKSHNELLNENYLTGFEFYIDDFRLEDNIKPPKKQTLLQRLLRKPKEETYFMSPEVDGSLSPMRKVITFNWGFSDTFEFRMARLASVTLSKLVNGLTYYPAEDQWFDNSTSIEQGLREVEEFEKSLKPKEFRVHKFENWL